MITLGGLDLFYGKVKFGNSGLYLENVTTIHSFKIIAACDLEVGNQVCMVVLILGLDIRTERIQDHWSSGIWKMLESHIM